MTVAEQRDTLPKVRIEDLEQHVKTLDIAKAAAIYKEHGALVVRGLAARYATRIGQEIMTKVGESIALLDQARVIDEGWSTPNGALFIPAPKNFSRDKQIMCVPYSYRTSGTFLASALDPLRLDILEAILGPDFELFDEGQVLVKEAVGGHAKNLHQDAAYFEHKYEGPVAILCYAVDTDLQNGALHVIPGSHRLGVLNHIDTSSHLGLSETEWPWESALPICGKAGDAIFFNVKTVHGSKPNWSNAPRPVFISRYRRLDDFVTVSATTVAKRSKAEESRDAKSHKVAAEFRYVVRGYRPS